MRIEHRFMIWTSRSHARLLHCMVYGDRVDNSRKEEISSDCGDIRTLICGRINNKNSTKDEVFFASLMLDYFFFCKRSQWHFFYSPMSKSVMINNIINTSHTFPKKEIPIEDCQLSWNSIQMH